MEVSICITNTGSTALGPNLNLYSNVDNYTSILATIPLSSLVAPNCPYIATTVPDGATSIRLIDPNSGCCFFLPFGEGFNICEICEPLGFSDTTNPNIGRLSIGQLTGQCDGNVTNYYLDWYGPGTGSTNFVFSSGLNANYNTPNYQHPLTGTTGPLLFAGQYRPIIREMEVGNVIYSQNFGAVGDCFQDNPFVIEPYTTQNGSFVDSYQHCLDVDNFNVSPANSSFGTIELSANTNYVPYRINSGPNANLFRIYFSGANYITPILIESLMVGTFISGFPLPPTEFNVNLASFDFKRWTNTSTFTKVLCLTGLTRSSNDILYFDIDNQNPTGQTFNFCFSQLQNFDCELCALTNQDYRIVENTITAFTGTCGALTVNFNVSGCSSNVDQNRDLYKYIFSGSGSASLGQAYGSVPKTISLTNQGYTNCFAKINLANILDDQPTCNVYITENYMRVSNFIQGTPPTSYRVFSFQTPNVPSDPSYQYIKRLYDSYLENLAAAQNLNIYNNSNPNLANYWTVINLSTQKFLETSAYGNCDPTSAGYYNPLTKPDDLKTSFAWPELGVSSGITIDYAFNPAGVECIYINIGGPNFQYDPLQTISLNTFPESPCVSSACNSSLDNENIFLSLINQCSNYQDSTANDYFDLVIPPGKKIRYSSNPWDIDSPNVVIGGLIYTGNTSNLLTMFQYENKTYPLTGSTGNFSVNFNQSAITCPNIVNYTYDENSGSTVLNKYTKYHYNYTVRYKNNLIQNEYEMLAVPILPNGQPNLNTSPILIGSGNTVGNSFTIINSSYFTP